MHSKITINIETDDAALAGRIAAAFGGTDTDFGRYVAGVTDDLTPEFTNTGGSHPSSDQHAATAEMTTHPATTATGAGTADPATGSGQNSTDARRDHKGVAFNVHYCGEAQEPFYTSGKRSGQWKKKRGLSDKDYDDWYAEELAELQGGGGEPDPEPVNSAAAFGSPQQQQQQPTAPRDTGAFMGWVAEKQAAGLITQDDIQKAYGEVGVQVADLFPPNDHAAIARAIGGLHGVLSQKAGA